MDSYRCALVEKKLPLLFSKESKGKLLSSKGSLKETKELGL